MKIDAKKIDCMKIDVKKIDCMKIDAKIENRLLRKSITKRYHRSLENRLSKNL